jgi:hypothetical protein
MVVNDLDRIEEALATKRLDPVVFERCAQDLLTELNPGLTPIPGGTDWGRDADIAGSGEDVPPRLVVTSARTLTGVRQNMQRGITSMREHDVPVERIVLANPASLSLLERQRLVEAARRAGARLDASDIFGRGFFASRLRRDGHWRNALLGLSSEPITLSRTPAELAESPWAILPLVAREEDLAALQGTDDLILTGPPGVGKSRLAGELPGAAFVDKDAGVEQIARDLRWALPQAVIVDDAGGQDILLRRLLSMRQTEPDLFTFRLVVICWPDGVDGIGVVMPAARLHMLDLVERASMDDLLRAMGIIGRLACQEILDQAEGRPAWGIALADLLLRARDVESLLRGRALLGQVNRYLRRAGVGPDVMDVLAVVSALGGVSETELPLLADETGPARPEVARAMGSAATSGLIDIASRTGVDGHEVRFYTVRPPMLASALVAERAFHAMVPAVDFDGLVHRWPDRLGELAGAAVDSAVLGATNARHRAELLTDRALASDTVGHDVKIDLAGRFLRLDRRAGDHVMALTRVSFDGAVAGGDDGHALEPVVSLAAAVAGLYEADAAFELLFDASLVDKRQTNPNPGHPLRQLADLVERFHPETTPRVGLRYRMANALMRWLDRAPDDTARRAAAAMVLQTLLSLRRRSAHSDPGRPMTLQLAETVLPADEIRQVFRELWPLAARMLDDDNQELAQTLVDVASEWLYTGGGHDRPFGQDHPPDCVAAAKEVGKALVANLAARPDLSLGVRLRLQSTAAWHGVPVTVEIPADVEVLFRHLDRRQTRGQLAEQELVADLQQVGEAWASRDPAATTQRLVELRTELERANLRWPDRPAIVCAALADHVADPMAWLDAAEAAGLMPEGCHFARRALVDGKLTEARARTLLTAPTSRWPMLRILLAARSAPPWATQHAVEALEPDDFPVVETMAIRGELPADVAGGLFAETPGPVRGMVALAMFAGRGWGTAWTPRDLESPWLEAVLHLRPAHLRGQDHVITELFLYLADAYPQTLADLVERVLAEADDGQRYKSLPHDAWNMLHRLQAAQKLQLWRRFQTEPIIRYLLQQHLVGSDMAWLEKVLDAGEMTPDDALACFNGFGPHPPITDLAKLLVPRGVAPESIAWLRHAGVWTGNQSDRYQSIIDSFERMATDEDPNVKAVVAAGVSMFSAARDNAAARERSQRVRGER